MSPPSESELAPGRVTLQFRTRLRSPSKHVRDFEIKEATEFWEAQRTAIIVCDMWDRHWCDGASQRVDELAPFMNGVLTHARISGMLIVHAPSDTMEFYEGFAQRQKAIRAPRAPLSAKALLPDEPPLPIDDSDDGCTTPGQTAWWAWSRQHPAIEIAAEDVISDDGDEIYNVMHAAGIENLIMMGVHTNMCVLGRSFGLRRMVERGVNVVLVRDLTDSMYNPERAPFVSHCEGTALVVAHIEAYICPTILSTDLTGAPPFHFREADREGPEPI
ncbi:MAG: isochorismatase family protein [Fimbriimonas sp.]|nr:isochorismatase family protein [Fimbriimonas sp.]